MSGLIQRNPDGSTEGADPRSLSRAMLKGAGHEKRPILKAIREKCLDCCNANDAEVRKCTAVGCALWPYRMGTNPFNDRPGGKFPGNTAVPAQGDRPELGAAPMTGGA
jgi:hypothetical protein